MNRKLHNSLMAATACSVLLVAALMASTPAAPAAPSSIAAGPSLTAATASSESWKTHTRAPDPVGADIATRA